MRRPRLRRPSRLTWRARAPGSGCCARARRRARRASCRHCSRRNAARGLRSWLRWKALEGAGGVSRDRAQVVALYGSMVAKMGCADTRTNLSGQPCAPRSAGERAESRAAAATTAQLLPAWRLEPTQRTGCAERAYARLRAQPDKRRPQSPTCTGHSRACTADRTVLEPAALRALLMLDFSRQRRATEARRHGRVGRARHFALLLHRKCTLPFFPTPSFLFFFVLMPCGLRVLAIMDGPRGASSWHIAPVHLRWPSPPRLPLSARPHQTFSHEMNFRFLKYFEQPCSPRRPSDPRARGGSAVGHLKARQRARGHVRAWVRRPCAQALASRDAPVGGPCAGPRARAAQRARSPGCSARPSVRQRTPRPRPWPHGRDCSRWLRPSCRRSGCRRRRVAARPSRPCPWRAREGA